MITLSCSFDILTALKRITCVPLFSNTCKVAILFSLSFMSRHPCMRGMYTCAYIVQVSVA